MATIDLGKIKPIWKGDWAGSTAYEKNDMVLNGVNSYICTTAHTSSGTFSSDTANWDVMAYGAELPAQSGNANEFLQTDGTNLQWASVIQDYVKLTESYGGNTGALNFATIFSDNPEFRRYQVLLEATPVSTTNLKMRFSDNNGSFVGSGGYYDYMAHAQYGGQSSGSTQTWSSGNSEFRLNDFSAGADAANRWSFIIAGVGANETDMDSGYVGNYYLEENSNNYFVSGAIGGTMRRTGVVNGFQLFWASGNFAKHRIAIYGIR